LKLPASVVLVLGVLGGGLELVQQYAISLSASVHTYIGFGILVILAFGVVPLGASALARLIPGWLAAILTAAVGILQAVQQTFNISNGLHGVITVFIAIVAALGIVPTVISMSQHATARARGII
jgi:hypothetical protein